MFITTRSKLKLQIFTLMIIAEKYVKGHKNTNLSAINLLSQKQVDISRISIKHQDSISKWKETLNLLDIIAYKSSKYLIAKAIMILNDNIILFDKPKIKHINKKLHETATKCSTLYKYTWRVGRKTTEL